MTMLLRPSPSKQTPHYGAGAVEPAAMPWGGPSWTSTVPGHRPVPPLVTRVNERALLTNGLQGVMGPL